jgi:hypothetical protein
MKKTKDPREDKFELFSDYIKVISGSGNEYTITIERCTCRGFSFHKICRHYEQAEALGLIEKLKQQPKKELDFSHSSSNMLMRKDAIRKWLTKKNIAFTEEIVDKIEAMLKSKTKPEEVLSIAMAV